MTISFTAYGVPMQQGSSRGFAVPVRDSAGGIAVNERGAPRYRAVITSDTRRDLKVWRAKVASAAQAKCDGHLMTGPVKLSATFYLPRPKSLARHVRLHTKKPDLGKLIRAAEDAITGILWADDKQVVCYGDIWKRYTVAPQDTPRADFTITELDETGHPLLV